jgi:hypothetical protein
MTSPFPGLVPRIGLWAETGVRIGAIAALACVLVIASAARDPDAPDMQTALTEYVLPPAPPAAKDASDEPVAEPSGGAPAVASPVEGSVDLEATASHTVPSPAPSPEPEMDQVNRYLWAVYERTTTKRDGSGDFTWKDVAAAARLGITLGDYVIAGMDRDFRELLYRAGLAMDAAGIRWTILSAFRDDYRQGLAAGYKARTGDSLHGGSFTTGGYGHGCAIDIIDADSKSRVLWTWLDANRAQLGLERPLPGIDPAHVQPRGPWHAVAAALRMDRLAKEAPAQEVAAAAEPVDPGSDSASLAKEPATEEAATATEPVDLSTTSPSDADLMCIGLHHHQNLVMQANATITPPEHQSFKLAASTHRTAKLSASDKSSPKAGSHLAGRPSTSGEPKAATKAGPHAADPEKPSPHAKGAARSLPRNALHATAHGAGTT